MLGYEDDALKDRGVRRTSLQDRGVHRTSLQDRADTEWDPIVAWSGAEDGNQESRNTREPGCSKPVEGEIRKVRGWNEHADGHVNAYDRTICALLFGNRH
ncbi:hypothetical protein BC938DRAFT_473381 [Jimgerdemannia flammicorona]|uniref:Uncharacterized protein n=1 Tax=Jimgerdemannia flammicorona TaxID=994334 RepID=A0A433Q465_9FUNG|nr:hypothetical protein BC938DRAFT_473381 [Jimgerdemannia flammicorona]